MIQVLLIAAVIASMVAFLRHHGTASTSAGVKVGFVLFQGFLVIAIVLPDEVSDLAKYIGVGRGTDLVVYGIAVGFAFACINTYLRFRELESRYAELARAVALRDTR